VKASVTCLSVMAGDAGGWWWVVWVTLADVTLAGGVGGGFSGCGGGG
jgi:hypothetical protein